MIILRGMACGLVAGTIAGLSYSNNHSQVWAALIVLSAIFLFNTKPE